MSFPCSVSFCVFFFNETATTEIYTLSLHDALPISLSESTDLAMPAASRAWSKPPAAMARWASSSRHRSEEHTSELQSRLHLVCRLLLEKKKQPRQNLLDSQAEPSHELH